MIEIIAVIFSLLSVIYTVKKNIWSWVIGIVGIVFYGIVFYQTKTYSNLFLQFLFIFQSLYGIWDWKYNIDDKGDIKISRLTDNFPTILWVIFIYYILNAFVGSTDCDSITTSLSIVAMYLMAKRKIENWIVWGIADIVYVYMFFTQGLYLSSLLYLVFFILCIVGYKKWQKL